MKKIVVSVLISLGVLGLVTAANAKCGDSNAKPTLGNPAKCEAGKCAAGKCDNGKETGEVNATKEKVKVIEKVKCGAGKCGSK